MINFDVALITDIFDVYNIETALPVIDLEAIESHLMAAKEEEQKVSSSGLYFGALIKERLINKSTVDTKKNEDLREKQKKGKLFLTFM